MTPCQSCGAQVDGGCACEATKGESLCKWCGDSIAVHSPKGCAVCPCIAWAPETAPLTGAQLAAKYGFKPHTPAPAPSLDAQHDFSLCPKCGAWVPDFDGFGVLAHIRPVHPDGCGYCSHPSRDDGVCGICSHVAPPTLSEGGGE